MKATSLIFLLLLMPLAAVHGQNTKDGIVYSYIKNGARHYSAKPPPPGASEVRTISYRFNPTGTWVEKSGGTTYNFGDGYNFEYRRAPNPRVQNDFGTVEKGAWTVSPDSCAVGTAKGNLYIQAGTERCCYNAYFLGNNLVLSALAQPVFVGVCSDRVLINQVLPQ
jgi:hypothetical protein